MKILSELVSELGENVDNLNLVKMRSEKDAGLFINLCMSIPSLHWWYIQNLVCAEAELS